MCLLAPTLLHPPQEGDGQEIYIPLAETRNIDIYSFVSYSLICCVYTCTCIRYVFGIGVIYIGDVGDMGNVN